MRPLHVPPDHLSGGALLNVVQNQLEGRPEQNERCEQIKKKACEIKRTESLRILCCGSVPSSSKKTVQGCRSSTPDKILKDTTKEGLNNDADVVHRSNMARMGDLSAAEESGRGKGGGRHSREGSSDVVCF